MTDMVKKFNVAEEFVASQTVRGAKCNEALNVGSIFRKLGLDFGKGF